MENFYDSGKSDFRRGIPCSAVVEAEILNRFAHGSIAHESCGHVRPCVKRARHTVRMALGRRVRREEACAFGGYVRMHIERREDVRATARRRLAMSASSVWRVVRVCDKVCTWACMPLNICGTGRNAVSQKKLYSSS